MEPYPQEETLLNPSPALGIWISETPIEQIELVRAAIVQAGEAGTKEEALLYLNDLLRNFSLNRTVAACDIFGGNNIPTRPHQRLKALLTGAKENGNAQLWRDHGTKGHIAIPTMLAKPPEEILKQWNPGGRDADLIHEIKSLQRVLSTVSRQRNLAHFWTETTLMDDLARLIIPIFKTPAARLLQANRNPAEAPILLITIQSWLTALYAHIKTGKPRIFFREIPAISRRRRGISAGIIDAVEVLRINGKRPSKEQRLILRQLAQGRFASVSDLLRCLINFFRRPRGGISIEVGIIDFKFAVGDSDKFSGDAALNPVITMNEIEKQPLAKHNDQLLRYMAMASFGYQLECGGTPTLWNENANITLGRLKYFMPEQVVRHDIPATREILESFLSNVARRINPAKGRAQARQINNFLVGHAIKILGGSNNNGKNGANDNGHFPPPKKLADNQPFLLQEHQAAFEALEEIRKKDILRQEAELLERMANLRRDENLDPYDILDFNNRAGAKYRLNYGRLLQVIEEGQVFVGRNFSPGDGGHIQCLFADHSDAKSPSFHLKPEQASFICYGCKRWGRIDPQSIPPELNIEISYTSNGLRGFSRLKKELSAPMPSEEHYRVMAEMQKALQRNWLKNSAGKDYLWKKRQIDPDLAYSLGAGFATSSLVNDLLDAGISYDQIIFYGLVGISKNISTSYGITPLLRDRGLSLNDIRRECGKKRLPEKPVYGFPFFTLANRVTFPLEFEGGINSFYGRSIAASSKLPHFKLTKKFTKIPHGLFNFNALRQSHGRKLIIVEAAIDTLSLIQIGRCLNIDTENTVGIIGTLNFQILSAILKADTGELANGLDIDPSEIDETGKEKGQSGQKAAAQIIEQMRAGGYQNQISNFTEDFYREHPELEPAKDWNELLKRLNKS